MKRMSCENRERVGRYPDARLRATTRATTRSEQRDRCGNTTARDELAHWRVASASEREGARSRRWRQLGPQWGQALAEHVALHAQPRVAIAARRSVTATAPARRQRCRSGEQRCLTPCSCR